MVLSFTQVLPAEDIPQSRESLQVLGIVSPDVDARSLGFVDDQ